MKFLTKGRWALITGASAGIGKAFARQLAEKGCSLVLTARREGLLDNLAEELTGAYGVEVQIYSLDLAAPGAAEELINKLSDVPVSILINNVGRGITGPFEQANWQTISSMIDLNVKFTTELALKMLPRLKAQKNGARMVNVGSVAGYQGVHNFAAYAATKSYINILSEGLNWELRGSSLKVTCVKPGSTASEFFKVANMEGALMSRFNVSTCEYVASKAIAAMIKGKPEIVVGLINKLLVFSLRLSPREAVRLVISRLFGDLA